MHKQIVFTEEEWQRFRRQIGAELSKEMSRYKVTDKSDGVTVGSDGPASEMFWVGTGIIVVNEAIKA